MYEKFILTALRTSNLNYAGPYYFKINCGIQTEDNIARSQLTTEWLPETFRNNRTVTEYRLDVFTAPKEGGVHVKIY
jgi:hypothetical protein